MRTSVYRDGKGRDALQVVDLEEKYSDQRINVQSRVSREEVIAQ